MKIISAVAIITNCSLLAIRLAALVAHQELFASEARALAASLRTTISMASFASPAQLTECAKTSH